MGCLTCAEFIQAGEGTLCPESEGFYKEFITCVCTELCIPQCGSNVCSGSTATQDCINCITMACDVQFNQCANDF